MDIKVRYDDYRMGAMFVKPMKATAEDLNTYISTVRLGSSPLLRSWQLSRIDCRALAGKLMAHEELKELIFVDASDFILTIEIEHPKYEDRIIIGGNETRTYLVYTGNKKGIAKVVFGRVEGWLQKFLYDVQPKEHTLKYGRREKYGLLSNDAGVLSYVVVKRTSYGEENHQFGQPYTESTWGPAP